MKKIILSILAIFLLNLLATNAATINSASCSFSDVQSAVNSANSGDTVFVPSGSCSWSSSLIISKEITLIGDQNNRPTITIAHSGESGITIRPLNDRFIRVSNFIFRQTGGVNDAIVVEGWSDIPSFRIDNNRFEDFVTRTIRINGANRNTGGIGPYGLIDNNWFESTGAAFNGIYIYFGNDGNSWTTPHTFGTDKTVVIEDNTFNRIGPTAPGRPALDSSYNGPRWLFRYNTLNNWVAVLHGPDSAPTSTLQFEFNHNTIRVNGVSSYALFIRGGTGVATGNDIGIIGNPNNAGYNSAFHMWRGGPCSGGYPCFQQVGRGVVNNAEGSVPLYFWDNTYDPGGCCIGELWSVDPASDIQENRDFFLIPKPGYTELAYPHPLRNTGGDTTPPSQVTGLTATPISSSQINLAWNAASDNIGVTGYRIYRDGILVGTSTSTSYQDTGLLTSTQYTYTVAAYDAASNQGAQSSSVSEITQAASTHTLTVNKVGSGTVTGTGINCGSDCSESVTSGTQVTLTASPASGSTFSGWSGACSGTGSCIVTVNTATTVTATFTSQGSSTYYVDKTGGSNSNSGTSPASPWRDAPGMSLCNSICSSTSVQPGDTIYFDRDDTWLVTGTQGLYLIGGVTYIGDSWEADGGSTGTRATIRANDNLEAGVVRFRDHASESTIFKGFDVDANSHVATGIDINHRFWSLMDGALKRVENVEVRNVHSRQSNGQYKYGIIVSNFGGTAGFTQNVEILDCTVHDISRDGIALYPGDGVQDSIRYVTVRGCEVYNTGQDPDYGEGHGITVKGWVRDSTLEYNYVHDVDSSAVFISGPEDDGSQRSADNLIVRHNILTSQDNNGIIRLYSKGDKDVKIYGNIIHDNSATGGLSLAGSSSGNLDLLVYNNLFYNTFVDIGSHSLNVNSFEFKNNIVHYSSNQLRNANSITSQSNNILTSTNPGLKNPNNKPTGFIGTIGTDAQPNTDGFSLTSGSSALNTGATLAAQYSTSINSITRTSNWDIGPYESTATSSPVNGQCGSSLNACTAGSLNDITDSSSHYLWECVGSNGGSTDSCSLAKSSNDITNGLVGYWPLDEGSGTTMNDNSQNNNHGSLNSPSWVTGKSGNALRFGSQHVTVPHDSSLNAWSRITISAWVRPSALSSSDTILQKATNYGLKLDDTNSDELQFFFRGSTWAEFTSSNANLQTGEWANIAVTFDESSNEVKMYKNGILVGDGLITENLDTDSSSLHIGSDRNGNNDWQGDLDEIRIYDRVLSPAEITQLYQFIQGLEGDVNNDGVVNILDLLFVVNEIGKESFNPIADVNTDSSVNILDLVWIVNRMN